jgi:hypothetical protein
MRAFLGQVPLTRNPFSFLGEGEVTDPKVLAMVELEEAYANALNAIAKVVGVKPETMATSVSTAKMTFDQLLKNRTFLPYVMKVLAISAVIVKDNIRALLMTPQQLSNILQGADASVRGILSEDEVKAQLKAATDEVIARAPDKIKDHVKELLESSGITPQNLAPNIPEGANQPTMAVEAPATNELSTLAKIALVGVPLAVLATVGYLWRR